MRQFEVYLRKDLRLLVSEAFFPIVVMLVTAICMVFAFFATNTYASAVHANYNWASFTPPSPSSKRETRRPNPTGKRGQKRQDAPIRKKDPD